VYKLQKILSNNKATAAQKLPRIVCKEGVGNIAIEDKYVTL
jgi:hypothetical protein